MAWPCVTEGSFGSSIRDDHSLPGTSAISPQRSSAAAPPPRSGPDKSGTHAGAGFDIIELRGKAKKIGLGIQGGRDDDDDDDDHDHDRR